MDANPRRPCLSLRPGLSLRHGLSLRPGLSLMLIVGLALAGCRAEEVPAVGENDTTQAAEATSDTTLALVADEPEAMRDAVARDPEAFAALLDEVLTLPANRTVLVDKRHALAADYVPADLVELDSLSDRLVLSRPGHRLTSDATDALLEMSAAAEAEGITLVVSSAYRSYDYQAGVYARWVEQLGQTEADRVSARPGTSQHQLGTVIDFGCICDEFASQPAGIWLAENARRYGFSLSYPDGYEEITGYAYEPWHFRFVGRTATDFEQRYFAGIQQGMLEFLEREFLEPPGSGGTDD